jgi:hypothetical protein
MIKSGDKVTVISWLENGVRWTGVVEYITADGWVAIPDDLDDRLDEVPGGSVQKV